VPDTVSHAKANLRHAKEDQRQPDLWERRIAAGQGLVEANAQQRQSEVPTKREDREVEP
jgi:hypothetical protein